MRDRLTARQRRFVEEYLVDRNGAGAAQRAGYSERSARRVAYQLLHETPQVRSAIDEAVREQSERTGITADRVLRGLARIAEFDLRKAYDAHGRLLPPHLLPDDVALAISGVKTEECGAQASLPLTDAEGRPIALARTVDVRTEGRVPAYVALARHFGLFKDGGGGALDLAALEKAVRRVRELEP